MSEIDKIPAAMQIAVLLSTSNFGVKRLAELQALLESGRFDSPAVKRGLALFPKQESMADETVSNTLSQWVGQHSFSNSYM